MFHKEQVDATNLRIDSNYHFEWTISGCDFGGGSEGRWESHPEGGIVLLPNTGSDFFEWSHEGFKDHAKHGTQIEHAHVPADRDGDDIVHVHPERRAAGGGDADNAAPLFAHA